MKNHDFCILGVDTDSILIHKKDQSLFSEQEQKNLLEEINEMLPSLIKLDHDGYFQKVVILKSKNYILYDGKKIKLKGSSLKDNKKEPALREMLSRLIDCLLFDRQSEMPTIYHSYIREIHAIEDITRWCVKRTITKSVLESPRLNESKIRDAIDTTTVQEGDKQFLFSTISGMEPILAKGEPQFYKDGRPKIQPRQVLLTPEKFDGTVDIEHYLNRIYSTMEILANVVDMSQFIDYTKKKNKAALEEMLNE